MTIPIKQQRVVVVGGGAVGLTTALALLQSGFSNVLVCAKAFSPDTTSDGAGAIWRPFEMGVEENQPLIT